MQTAHNQFLSNIRYIKELDTLYVHLKDTLHLPNDLSDLLRAEIVYAVSALDKLVHELIRIGMLQTFEGSRVRTKSFDNFTLSAKTLDKIRETTIQRIQKANELQINVNSLPFSSMEELPSYWFEQQVVLTHKSEAYQDPEKITRGLSLIWQEEHKWQKIASRMNMPEKDIKTTLINIVTRRHQIVHEADIDFQTHMKTSIAHQDASYMVDFIERLGIAIYEAIIN
jgi:hypothetical protein